MTKKHFELLAKCIRLSLEETNDQIAGNAIIRSAKALAENLQKEFPRFNPEKFIGACKNG